MDGEDVEEGVLVDEEGEGVPGGGVDDEAIRIVAPVIGVWVRLADQPRHDDSYRFLVGAPEGVQVEFVPDGDSEGRCSL